MLSSRRKQNLGFMRPAIAGLAMVLAALFVSTSCSAQPYFPRSAFTDLNSYSAHVPEVFSNYLRSVQEPVIYSDEALEFAVRLTIKAGVRGGLVVRVSEARDGQIVAIARRFHAQAASEVAPRPVYERNLSVTPDDVLRIKRKISDANIWQTDNKQDVISGGSLWLLEVKDGKRFHAIYRLAPLSDSVFDVGSLLITLAHEELIDRDPR